eukprot:SAG11_NODE_3335_length_2519_cov_1.665289_1_plen_79_part_00
MKKQAGQLELMSSTPNVARMPEVMHEQSRHETCRRLRWLVLSRAFVKEAAALEGARPSVRITTDILQRRMWRQSCQGD